MKQKDIFISFLFITFLVPVFGQIVNNGILQINASTDVYFENEYTNNAEHHNDGELYLNHNFINNGDTYDTSTIATTNFNSSTNINQSISGTTNSIYFCNLTINNTGNGVTVADNFGVFVTDAVKLTEGILRLTGEAQLIQTHTGLDKNNAVNGSLLRDQQGTKSVYAFNYWSSPVNNGGTYSIDSGLKDGADASVNPFTPQQLLFNSGSPYNGAPSVVDGSGNVTTSSTLNNYWFNIYLKGAIGDYNHWQQINQSSALTPGVGYTAKGTGTTADFQNYVFKGIPNDGDYSFPLNLGESSLLGNPYPSALDSKVFINDNKAILELLQFWVDGGSTDHNLSNYLGGYAIRNLTGGVSPSIIPSIGGVGSAFGEIPERYIAVGQSFFVGATIGSGNIIFNNAQRIFVTEASGESIFFKPAESEKTNLENDINIRIGYVDPEGFHRQLLLAFLPGASVSMGFDIGYDAIMSDPREDELFFIIDGDETQLYVIQAIDNYDISLVIPLGLKITEAGTHTISLDAVENFTGTVYIYDNVTDVSYNISQGSYEPNVAPGDYYNRFSLVFQPQEVLAIEDLAQNNLKVYYAGNDNIVIDNVNQLKLENIVIYNMLGQQILKVDKNLLENNKINIPFSNTTGMYLVRILTDNGWSTFNILKK